MIFRTLLVWVLGLPITLILFICILILLPFDSSGDIVHSIGRLWSRILLFLSAVKVEIDGLQNIPNGPVIFVSNHQGAYDILILQAKLPYQFRWVAKESLFKIPLVGWSMSLAGYISIDRGRAILAYKSIERAARKIKREGISVMIFPEGTRSEGGRILPFKRGSFLLAVKSGVPVVPITIKGTRDIMRKGGFLIRPADVMVVIGTPIYPEGDGDRRLMERVRRAMEFAFG